MREFIQYVYAYKRQNVFVRDDILFRRKTSNSSCSHRGPFLWGYTAEGCPA